MRLARGAEAVRWSLNLQSKDHEKKGASSSAVYTFHKWRRPRAIGGISVRRAPSGGGLVSVPFHSFPCVNTQPHLDLKIGLS